MADRVRGAEPLSVVGAERLSWRDPLVSHREPPHDQDVRSSGHPAFWWASCRETAWRLGGSMGPCGLPTRASFCSKLETDCDYGGQAQP